MKLLFEGELRYQKQANLTDSDNSARLSGIAFLIVAGIVVVFWFLLNQSGWSTEQSDRLALFFGILGLLVALPALVVSFITAILSWKQGQTNPPQKSYTKGIALLGVLAPFILSLLIFLRWG